MQQMYCPSSINGRRPTTSPYIRIIEQPASKGLRFRYESEGRSAGSIPGVNSTTDNKTYPTIQIVGYKGRAIVIVTCVTKVELYRPHPHSLVGPNCKKGYCAIEINNESMVESFQNLGIQCVKRKDIDEALKVREYLQLDPFGTGFSHKEKKTKIDYNVVRLCFQAFLKDEKGNIRSILKPIVSDPIYDKKAMSDDLSICKLSDAAASVVGDKEIILLCEKVTKDDIQVRFFEEEDGECNWEDYGVFKAQDVHKQVAISFKTPKYKITEIEYPVKVWIQLKRPSDGMCSDALPFTFTPDYSDPVMLKRKRQKLLSESEVLIQLPSNPIRHIDQSSNFIDGMVDQSSISVSNEEEPEPSPNPLSGPLPHSSVLQHLPPYNSTPSTSKYPLPNEKYIISQTKFPNPNIRLNTTGHIDQSSNFIDGMVDQSSMVSSVSNEEEPEPSPNPLSGPLPHSSVLQHLPPYNSTPSTSKYPLPNEKYILSQTKFPNPNIRLNTTGHIDQSSNFIDGMVDQSSMVSSVSNEEEPEPSPNPLSGPLPHSSVLQHLPPYNSTPSTSKYPLPNEKYILSQTKFPNPNIRLNTTGHNIDQSSNFIDGMVDQSSISVSNEEEPEPTPNPLSGPLPHSSVLQHLPPYNSTPSTSKYPLPNEKYILSQTKFPNPNIRLNTTETSPDPYSGLYPLLNSSVLQHSPSYNSRTPSPQYQFPNVNPISLYGQTTNIRLNTTVWPTYYSHNSTDYDPTTTISTTHLPYTREGDNTSSFSSLDFSDLRTWLEDSEDDVEHALPTNYSASLHLTENSPREEFNPEIVVEDNINMSDSSDELF